MDAISLSALRNASSADPSTVQGAAALTVMKKAMNLQAATAATLLQSLPQPSLATAGSLGTQVNAYA